MTNSEHKNVVIITADGACKGNPGPGGWGAVLRWNETVKEVYGGEQDTTNNRMELKGVIAAFEMLKRPVTVIVTTDSKYVCDGMSKWIHKWKENYWRSSTGAVKNRDLWEKLDNLQAEHTVTWQWVRGHSGHPDQELADKLANKGAKECIASDTTSTC